MAAIYLLRHGEAVSRDGARFAHDSERPLSVEGRVRMQLAALGMKKLAFSFDRVFTSPYVRARQTAEVVAAAVGADCGVVVEEALASGARWEKVKRALAAVRGPESILLVGHEPDLSKMTAEIIGADRNSVSFGKGTLACIAVDAIPPREPGALSSLLTLEHLEALGS